MTIYDLIDEAKSRDCTRVQETYYLSLGVIHTIYSKDHNRFLFLNYFINNELSRIEHEGNVTAKQIIDCLDNSEYDGRVNLCYNKTNGLMVGW